MARSAARRTASSLSACAGRNAFRIISGPNVGGAQTGISGIVASDATFTSGTVVFTGVGGGVTEATYTFSSDFNVQTVANATGALRFSGVIAGWSFAPVDGATGTTLSLSLTNSVGPVVVVIEKIAFRIVRRDVADALATVPVPDLIDETSLALAPVLVGL